MNDISCWNHLSLPVINNMNTKNIKLDDVVEKLFQSNNQFIKHYVGNQVVCTSYQDLAKDVMIVVSKLQEAGIGSGDCVGVLADNCYEWIVLDLAIIHLEAVCVGIPSEVFGNSDFDYLAETYDICILFSDKAKDKPSRSWLFELNDIFNVAYNKKEVVNPKIQDKHDLFSLSFSSGTSGDVKCLKFSRQGTNSLLAAFGRDFDFHSTDSIFAFLPLSTIQQRWMLYTSIFYGFNLCLCTPARIFSALKEMKPTIVCSAPLLFETVEKQYLLLDVKLRAIIKILTIVAHTFPDALRKYLLKILYSKIYDFFGNEIRFFLVGAAASRMSTLKFYKSIGLPLYEAWGVTEAGFLSWNMPGKSKLGSVGVEVYKNTLEIAKDGEIIVHHDSLPCLGYYNVDSEEENRVFPRPGLMATGDIGYFDDDGYLHIIGRKKDMIVTRGGYKIQPADLEKEIKKNLYVNDAVVICGSDCNSLSVVISTRGNYSNLKENIKKSILAMNRMKPAPSRILKVIFTDDDFSRENKLLNGNLKVDRQKVFDKFKSQLIN